MRELRNAIEYAFVLCHGGDIGVEHLPKRIMGSANRPRTACPPDPARHREREQLIEALRQAGGNQSRAARILGVSRVTIWKRIKRWEVDFRQLEI